MAVTAPLTVLRGYYVNYNLPKNLLKQHRYAGSREGAQFLHLEWEGAGGGEDFTLSPNCIFCDLLNTRIKICKVTSDITKDG